MYAFVKLMPKAKHLTLSVCDSPTKCAAVKYEFDHVYVKN